MHMILLWFVLLWCLTKFDSLLSTRGGLPAPTQGWEMIENGNINWIYQDKS